MWLLRKPDWELMVMFQEFEDLLVDRFLYDFCREGEQGDGPVVVEFVRVSRGVSSVGR